MKTTNLKKSVVKFVMLLILIIIFANIIEAQPDLSKVKTEVVKVKGDVIDIVNAIVAVLMVVCMIGVIYMLASKSERAKEALIGWFAALVFWGVAYLVFK